MAGLLGFGPPGRSKRRRGATQGFGGRSLSGGGPSGAGRPAGGSRWAACEVGGVRPGCGDGGGRGDSSSSSSGCGGGGGKQWDGGQTCWKNVSLNM